MTNGAHTHQSTACSATLRAPAASCFAPFPASWYLFGSVQQLRDKPLSKRMLGRQLVAFRSVSGKFAVLDARCSHLGADLGRGNVVGESIQCPFHNWRYGREGLCTHIPGAAQIPSFARQASYPFVERHGYLFFFNGTEALFPLPFFLGADPEEYSAGKLFSYVADCTWYMNAAHGYDMQHFGAVHDRKLVAPPRVDCPAPYARRNRYQAEVVGRTVFDRLLRIFAGRTVEISITTWGGTLALITGDFERVRSRFLIAMQPLENGRTLCEGIVFAQRSRSAMARGLVAPVSLWVRRLFTHGYLADEARRLRGTRYNPSALIENDRDMVDFFHWVSTLPQSAATMPHSDGITGETKSSSCLPARAEAQQIS